ncbi:DUF2946 family protein [Terricaulis sp.]|uniref:DUF2946 family protein n=1 Tax=Terricaulis sp. TaxID=2768686 RepID=UPI0037839E91
MAKSRHRPPSFRLRSEGLSAFVRTVAVLALAIQCLVIQTHVDFAARDTAVQTAAVAAQSVVVASQDSGAPVHRAKSDCVICQAAATTRTSLSTPAFALPLDAGAALPVALQTVAERAPRIAAHTWQSRAPPAQI